MTGLLDDDEDDFDESILQEIDALIEQKTTLKSQHDVNASVLPVVTANGTDSANHGLPPSMPDEYSKYLQSLNERQREAACSDIATPLMIAAGPGSGKTSTMVGRVLMLLNEVLPLSL